MSSLDNSNNNSIYFKGVSIIIVNYNSSNYTVNCIQSIIKLENHKKYEIIVIDNNSDDDNKNILKTNIYGLNNDNIRVIFNSNNCGFGLANNIGVKESKYDYILLLNTDTLMGKSVLEFCIDKIENKTDIGIVGIQLLNFDETRQISYGYFPSIRQEVFELLPFKFKKRFEGFMRPLGSLLYDTEELREVEYISGAFMFMKKSIFERAGGFNNKYFMYFEETDMCKRVNDLGYRNIIFNYNAIKHKGSAVIGKFSVYKAKIFIQSKIIFLVEHSKNYKLIMRLSKLNGYIKYIFYTRIDKKEENKNKALYWEVFYKNS